MKPQFFGHLSADHVEGKWWRLRQPLAFYSAKYDLTICAPPELVVDFASVPRLPFLYLLAGGTGNWESTIHDVVYRFGSPKRIPGDLIFYEAGRVRAKMREKQNTALSVGRWVRTSAMTAVVGGLGWVGYSPLPGCLDYRNRKQCRQKCRIDQDKCDHYYPEWRDCVLPGYMPDILKMHGG